MIQLTKSQLQANCWYNIKEYSPPDNVQVIVSDGNEWVVGYTIGKGTSWVWFMRNDFKEAAWSLPGLPNPAVIETFK
jgi:hypothetical protein